MVFHRRAVFLSVSRSVLPVLPLRHRRSTESSIWEVRANARKCPDDSPTTAVQGPYHKRRHVITWLRREHLALIGKEWVPSDAVADDVD
jgi:hypothetical protein